MTLRLTEEETEALRRAAETEGRSMQEVARSAIRDYVGRRESALREVFALTAERDREILDRFAK